MKSGLKVSAIILAIASIAIASCKKDKSGPPGGNPGTPAKKITRIEENGNTSATFEYNADGTLKKVSTIFSPGNTTIFTFTYNAQKKLAEFISDEGYRAKYIYQNNVLTLTENFEGGVKTSENSFVYENGRLKSNTLFTAFPQDGGNILYLPTYRAVFSYHPNGNMKRIDTYVLNQQTDQLELEHSYLYKQYDDKKSPLSVMTDFSQVMLYQPININNSLAEELLDEAGNVMESTTNTYTYDAAGYPVTCKSTVTPAGGTATVINAKYFY